MIRPPNILILMAALWGVQASALDFQRHDGRFVLPAGTNLSSETILLAESMELNAGARDDLFLLATGAGFLSQDAAGGRIALNGEYDNDVWAWGTHVVLRGHVRDHARLGGVSVVVHGRISGNALLAANNVHLARTAELDARARIYAENAICEGRVAGDLHVIGGNVTLAGRFAGNVQVNARDLVMLPGAVIDGDLEYWAPKKISVPAGVTLHGKLRRMPASVVKPASKMRAVLPGLIWSFLSTLCVGILWVVFLPGVAGDAARQARHAPGRALTTGVVFVLAAPPTLLVLMLSIIGLPAALLLAALSVMLVYLGKLTLALALGLLLLPAPALPRRVLLQRLTVGLLVMHMATFPVSAWPVWILSATMGAGALLRAGQVKKIN